MPRIHEFESPIRAFVVKIRGRFEPNAAKPQNPAESEILEALIGFGLVIPKERQRLRNLACGGSGFSLLLETTFFCILSKFWGRQTSEVLKQVEKIQFFASIFR